MGSAIRLVVLAAAGLGLASCATAPSPSGEGPPGTAGPVTWQITDIGLLSSIDDLRFRWSYVVVLRNTGRVSVELQQVETSYISRSAGDVIGGTPTMQPFRRSLAPGAEFRVPVVDDWGWMGNRGPVFGGAATLDAVTALRRYLGTDAAGQPVAVPVRLELHRGVGKRSSPPRAPGQLPAPERLRVSDLPHLSGKWRGSQLLPGGVLYVPLEITVSSDGTFEAGVNDPVTTRFSGSLRIADGWVHVSAGPDSGRLALYEAGARQFLAGTVSGPRAEGQTLAFALYLERDATATPPPPPRSR